MINTNQSGEVVDYLNSGHVGCPGCGAMVAMKFTLRVLGEKTIVVIPACCWAILGGAHPYSSLDVPILHTAFATAGATASGVRAALDMKGDKETTVIAWAGDGGTFDIGIQALSGAAERNENIIYICYDNEAYMNTGVQRSSSTPYGTRTTTTPGKGWKTTNKKNIMDIMAAHKIPYAATASIAYPEDLMKKVKKAKEITTGTRFLHIYASCPTGWKIASEQSIEYARLAVKSNVFPLYEVEDHGRKYTINYEGDLPASDYLKGQGRFKHLDSDALAVIQNQVTETWQDLKKRV